MGTVNRNEPKVGFTREQLEYLEKQFPEDLTLRNTDDMYIQTGKRMVVKHIAWLIEQSLKRAQQEKL